MALLFSPAGCCCCPPLDDFCTACGAEVEQTGRFEAILSGIRNCDPPTLQSCDDCDGYDGTYLLDYVTLESTDSTRRCIYRYVLEQETCNQRFPAQMAQSHVELRITYTRYSPDHCTTILEGFVRAHNLPATLKGAFRRELPGLQRCGSLMGITLPPHPLYLPCSNNIVCDFSEAEMTISWLESSSA